MHPQNPYIERYNLQRLAEHHSPLKEHIILNPAGEKTIDFGSSNAIFDLNKAMLLADFGLTNYDLPIGYLVPPIPGRLDYLLYLRDFLSETFNINDKTTLRGLDIGSGANAIYCILAAQYLNYNMVGAESDEKAVEIANANLQRTPELVNKVQIRHQENNSFLFKNMIGDNEKFDFTVCNPPFHRSREEAIKGSLRKLKNLGTETSQPELTLNFEGQANELWCNGGEALFIKRLIKESLSFKSQVQAFSCLVSKAENLSKIEKHLKKANANYHIIKMTIGNKKSRVIVWWFN